MMVGKRRAPSSVAAPAGLEPGEVTPRAGVGGGGRIAEVQRARMLTAMVQEASERGAANVSVGHVVARCGVSRRTFYEIFDSREDCFLAAFDDSVARLAAEVVPAYSRPGPWRSKTRAALVAFLEALDSDRDVARVIVVESLAAGEQALERRQVVLAAVSSVLDEGRDEARAGAEPPELTAEGVAGGVLSVLHARLTERNSHSLVELMNPLMGMIVMPYLGVAAARKESERPVSRIGAARKRGSRNNPLQELPMRFTYRTMRVLMTLATRPGSSNRMVARDAGIPDQGQASKLLGRLHRLGLIENEGGEPARGEANAWVLTSTGREVYESVAGLEQGQVEVSMRAVAVRE